MASQNTPNTHRPKTVFTTPGGFTLGGGIQNSITNNTSHDTNPTTTNSDLADRPNPADDRQTIAGPSQKKTNKFSASLAKARSRMFAESERRDLESGLQGGKNRHFWWSRKGAEFRILALLMGLIALAMIVYGWSQARDMKRKESQGFV